ncbi:MAG: hypothetical protein NT126_00720 [Bacteroidetes bacterium]|nr:hypothetical protein [Bacteroidota bacterium]
MTHSMKLIPGTLQWVIVFTVMFLFSCTHQVPAKGEYMPELEEIYRIECDHLHKAGIDVSGKAAYDIRSLAFQEILKDLDRAMLSHYELLYQDLATKEYLMTDQEKKEYYDDIEKLYSKGCR